MIRLMPIPKKVGIAISGGVDSMACLHFLKKMRYDVTPVYFNHKTLYGEEVEVFLRNEIPGVIFGSYDAKQKDPKSSKEEDWRNQRYVFLRNVCQSHNLSMITCHHLDDAVETWIFTSIHGQGKLIPVTNIGIIRPFLLNRKSELLNWAERYHVKFLEDPSNKDLSYRRNYIRHQLMPHALAVNPGLHKTIRKKYENLF